MKAHRELILLLSIVVAASGWGCSTQVTQPTSPATTPQPSPSPSPTPIKPTKAGPIEETWSTRHTFVTKSISEKKDYELYAEYPQVTRAQTDSLRRFNRWIKKRVLGHAARFRRFAAAERRNRKGKKPLIEEGLELTFIVYYSDDRLISLRLTHRVMQLGQMHPIDYYETINYDLEKGRPLRAGDVFKRGYLQVMSTYSREYLTGRYEILVESALLDGTVPRSNNFQNWNIVPDGILISFEDYQVGPHTFGQPELVVPYSLLANVIVRNSAARQFLARS